MQKRCELSTEQFQLIGLHLTGLYIMAKDITLQQ